MIPTLLEQDKVYERLYVDCAKLRALHRTFWVFPLLTLVFGAITIFIMVEMFIVPFPEIGLKYVLVAEFASFIPLLIAINAWKETVFDGRKLDASVDRHLQELLASTGKAVSITFVP